MITDALQRFTCNWGEMRPAIQGPDNKREQWIRASDVDAVLATVQGAAQEGSDGNDSAIAEVGHLRGLRRSESDQLEGVLEMPPSITDVELLTMWRSVQGPRAGLTGPLIRFAALVQAAGEARAPHELPADVSVAGDFNRPLYEFERACLVHLAEEQRRTNPDNALIATLCDAVRLSREHADMLFRGKIEIVMEAQEARAAQPLDWQPIATAPKGSWPDGPQDTRDPNYVAPPRLWLTLEDGQRCVGYFDAYYAEGGNAYDGAPPWVEQFSGERIHPTHWMPLPDPPAAVPHVEKETK